ncbi:MAG: right-handed parallel beta-helix repeat-containing protein [Verrucomicrobiales bacterium]|nr:right-handed parallel beta-helix repeat-containing protein [Verrucomicrobiales bacterium]
MRLFYPLLAFASLAGAADLELSPSGPIQTPRAARDAARAAAKPVRILVADGTYAMTGPLTLGPEDSGVTWEAAPSAKPVFTGGREITGWKEVEKGLWKATLPDKNWHFEQLWIDGRRAVRARTPNQGYHHLDGAVGAGVFPGLDADSNFHAFTLHEPDYELLKAIPAAERADVLLTITHAWAVGQCRIEALHDESRAVKIKGRASYPFIEFEPDQRFWVENFRAALDSPGEWYLDREKGEVLYRPLKGEAIGKTTFTAPIAERFLVAKGAKDLVFRGIAFRHAQYLYPSEGLHDRQAATGLGAALEFEDCANIRIESCEIGHVGEYGVYFKNGCSDSTLTKSHLHDLGGGGVRIGETARPEEARVCRKIVVDDCILQHGGRLHPSACGVVLTHTQHCAVTHCDIGDFYYTGVSAGWNWGYGDTASRETLVENNHIHHLGWAYLSDMGGFYGLGVSPGTIIRGNHVHHIASHRYGGWGLYTDEGSTDVTMENNLVHDTWNSGFHQHYGFFNTIRNNIFAFGHTAQIQRSRNEAHLSFRYEGNLVVWDPASPLLDGGEWNWKYFDKPERGDPKDSLVFRRNLYWRTDGKIPDTLTKTHFTWDEWRKMGRDEGSLYADPMFEDLAKRDFRLKPGGPAEKIGFKPWDLTLAGVRKDDPAWSALAAEGHDYPTWEADAKPWPAPEYRIDLQTFERVPVGAIGIRNAKSDRPREQKPVGEGFAVSEEAASPFPLPDGAVSKRSLKAQDKPDLVHSYDPVLDVFPRWAAGTFRVAFDLMARDGADGFFEMRVKGGEFAAGPYLRWQGGKLVANNTASLPLGELAPGEWVRIEVIAKTGAGHYCVTLTKPDGTKREFKDLPCKPTWNEASYLLFTGLGTKDTAYFLDNLSLVPIEMDPIAP